MCVCVCVHACTRVRVCGCLMVIECVYLCFCAGFVANGEYNVLRSNGYTRPLSVFKVRADTRGKYAKMGKKKMLRMITLLVSNVYILNISNLFMNSYNKCR